MDLSVAVLAGGRSRRMGVDKAQLVLQGSTFLERIAGAARDAGHPVTIIGRERPPSWRDDRVAFLPDEIPGLGPLGGLLTAFHHTGTDLLLSGCDMPLLTADAFRWLAVRAEETEGGDGILPTDREGREQFLFAVYRTDLIPPIEERIRERQLALRDLIAAGDFTKVPLPTDLLPEIRSINTVEEYGELL